jgi:hypothetical protein
VSKTIVDALIMWRRWLRDREFAGIRVWPTATRDGHQLDDFLTKSHPASAGGIRERTGPGIEQTFSPNESRFAGFDHGAGTRLRKPSLRKSRA